MILLSSVFGIAVSPLTVSAIPYQSNTVYKATDRRNEVVVFSSTLG